MPTRTGQHLGSGSDVIPRRILDQSVEVLQLSVRPSNCLLHEGRNGWRIDSKEHRRLDGYPKYGQEVGRRNTRATVNIGFGSDSAARWNKFVSGSFSLAVLLPFETCDIPIKIAEHLRIAGVRSILDLLGMDVDAIRVRAKLRPDELQTLQTSLVAHRLRLGSRPLRWIADHSKECHSAFRDDINRIIGTREVAGSESLVTQLAPSPPSCLEEELEGLLSSRAREKWLPIIRRVLGWDGGVGSTLETAGQEFGLTRERIRQIVSAAAKSASA